MENKLVWESLTDAKLTDTLDELFPDSGHHEVVLYGSNAYRKHFKPRFKFGNTARPCGKLGGGKVQEWEYQWQQGKRLEESSIESRLDLLYPGARSNQEVTFENKRYRKKFSPVFSRSMKTIHRWDRYWEELGPA